MDSIDAELNHILDGGKPSTNEIEAIKEQVQEWLKECNGDVYALLKKVIDQSPGDHLILIRTRCRPGGHSDAELYAANAGFVDMLEMLSDSLHQLVANARNITEEVIEGIDGENDEDAMDEES